MITLKSQGKTLVIVAVTSCLAIGVVTSPSQASDMKVNMLRAFSSTTKGSRQVQVKPEVGRYHVVHFEHAMLGAPDPGGMQHPKGGGIGRGGGRMRRF
jgi:hypothetical protein